MTKQEILNYIFKSKDGASWNEVSEMLNEFESDIVKCEQLKCQQHESVKS